MLVIKAPMHDAHKELPEESCECLICNYEEGGSVLSDGYFMQSHYSSRYKLFNCHDFFSKAQVKANQFKKNNLYWCRLEEMEWTKGEENVSDL